VQERTLATSSAKYKFTDFRSLGQACSPLGNIYVVFTDYICLSENPSCFARVIKPKLWIFFYKTLSIRVRYNEKMASKKVAS
jgi:hypothetical protein